MTIPIPSGGRLLVPYKQWSGDPREDNNMVAIERWALYVHNCLAPPTPSPTNSVSRIHLTGTVNVPNSIGTAFDWSTLSVDAHGALGSNISVSTTNLNITNAGIGLWLFRFDPQRYNPGTFCGYHFTDSLTSFNIINQWDLNLGVGGPPTPFADQPGFGGYIFPAGDSLNLFTNNNSGGVVSTIIDFTLTTISL